MSDSIERTPRILKETAEWAIVFKPHGMPSAPLAEDEQGTLLAWFLAERPEADAVVGRKTVERGLLHRLDTETEGVVLIAKTQAAFGALSRSQGAGMIEKRYAAFCYPASETVWGIPPLRAFSTAPWLNRETLGEGLPITIASRFRSYGPGGKRVLPLFPSMRGYDTAGNEYSTAIERVDLLPDINTIRVLASLVRGFRHQVRAHLASIGLPIAGDELYGGGVAEDRRDAIPLQLHAIAISFPDPQDGTKVSFSLPLPDRMSR